MEMPQLWAAPKLVAFVEEAGGSGSACSGIGVGSVPGFAIDGLDGFHFFLRKRLVHLGKLFANKGLEFAGHVIELFFQRIDARHLIVAWTALIVQNRTIELRCLFAYALFACDGASFCRSNNLLSH